MALLVPDVSLLRFTPVKKKQFMNKNATFYIWDKYSPLTVCLHLMEPNYLGCPALAAWLSS